MEMCTSIAGPVIDKKGTIAAILPAKDIEIF